jgi:hypothetical protein
VSERMLPGRVSELGWAGWLYDTKGRYTLPCFLCFCTFNALDGWDGWDDILYVRISCMHKNSNQMMDLVSLRNTLWEEWL